MACSDLGCLNNRFSGMHHFHRSIDDKENEEKTKNKDKEKNKEKGLRNLSFFLTELL